MDRMFPPPANNQPPRDPNGPNGPFGPYGPHGPHFPEPWHNHYGRYPHPYLHAPHGLHPFFGERPWDHIHCAPECDDQLPIFSTVGRGLRGDSYRVKVAYDAEGETYLEGGYYDANTNTYHTDWTSENINGGHLMYQYNLRTNTNPQTFTITFRYVRPERSESEWVWTTPAIPYIWDADNDGIGDTDNIVGAGVATLFLKKTTDSNWVTPSDANTPHTVAQAKNVQEKLLYPSGWTRSMFNSPAATSPWTVNLEYGVGGDIDVPTVEDLAKIIGVTPDYLREIVNERAIPVNIDFGHDGNGHPYNVKEYIDNQDNALSNALKMHLHKDLLGTAYNNTDIIPTEIRPPLLGDGGTKGVWDWITWLKDYVDDNMLDISHLHNDLFGNHSPNSLPDELGELKHDGSNTQSGYQNYGVWDWILWLKDHLHKDIFGNHGDANTPENQRQQGITYDIPHSLVTLLGDGGSSGVWDWIKETIKTVLGIGKAGAWPGSLAGFGGTKTVWDWINGVSDPKMYTLNLTQIDNHPVVFVAYKLPEDADLPQGATVKNHLAIGDSSTGSTTITPTVIAPARDGEGTIYTGVLTGSLGISYYDVLPDITISFNFSTERITVGSDSLLPVIFSKSGYMIVACTNNGTSQNPQYVPINLANINLPQRGANIKKPVFYTENLSNSGYLQAPDGATVESGMFSIYTGIGNVKGTLNNTTNRHCDWPWTEDSPNNNGAFYAYIFDRHGGGSVDRIVMIDGFRNYDVKFTQATRG